MKRTEATYPVKISKLYLSKYVAIVTAMLLAFNGDIHAQFLEGQTEILDPSWVAPINPEPGTSLIEDSIYFGSSDPVTFDDPGGPGGGGDPGDGGGGQIIDEPEFIPLDGGLAVLISAALASGLRVRRRREKKDSIQ